MATNNIWVKNIDEVNVYVHCEQGIAWELRDYFTFKVPGYQFTPAYKSRMWDGKIRLFDVRSNTIYRGLVPHIETFAKDRGYTFQHDDSYLEEFSIKEAEDFIKTLNLPENIVPRDYQLDAFVHAIRNRRALLLSPTASGKSLIIYMLLRYAHKNLGVKKSLVIVPTISLVSQMFGDFRDYGFDSDKYIHRVFQGQEKDSKKPIIVSTWQSVYTQKKQYFKQFDCIIGDEAHQFKAKSLIHIMTGLTNAKYRFGTTGTLDGTKTHKLVLEGLFGPVEKVTTTKKLMEEKHVADFNIKCLVLKHNDINCKLLKKATYDEEIKYLVNSDSRNKFIKNLALSLEGNTLVLFNYIEHGEHLYNLINKEKEAFYVSGKIKGEVREEIRHLVEDHKNCVIVASYGVFSTGVNIKNLHNIIFASPSKSRIRNLQSIGRGLRVSETKTKAVLFDIADDLRYKSKKNYTLGHFEERIKIYSEEKFPFRVYKIDLKG